MVYLLGLICIAIPTLASIVELGPHSSMIERHHRHHDVYRAKATFSTTLVLVMIFMAAICLLLVLLCTFDVFDISVDPIVGFFSTFMIVMFLTWLAVIRYQVSTYPDHLILCPFVGAKKTLMYADIVRMRRGSVLEFLGYHSLHIWDAKQQHFFIWGALDVDNILLKINRFDVLDDRYN